MAKHYPDYFQKLILDIADKRSYKIMKLRYKDELKFKQIPELVYLEERQVYKIHQKVIDKLITI